MKKPKSNNSGKTCSGRKNNKTIVIPPEVEEAAVDAYQEWLRELQEMGMNVDEEATLSTAEKLPGPFPPFIDDPIEGAFVMAFAEGWISREGRLPRRHFADPDDYGNGVVVGVVKGCQLRDEEQRFSRLVQTDNFPDLTSDLFVRAVEEAKCWSADLEKRGLRSSTPRPPKMAPWRSFLEEPPIPVTREEVVFAEWFEIGWRASEGLARGKPIWEPYDVELDESGKLTIAGSCDEDAVRRGFQAGWNAWRDEIS